MRIKRFVAADMRSAIRQVRDEQGPDAVILSNQKVDEGIEIIAAVDYDAQLMNDALALTSNQHRAQQRQVEQRYAAIQASGSQAVSETPASQAPAAATSPATTTPDNKPDAAEVDAQERGAGGAAAGLLRAALRKAARPSPPDTPDAEVEAGHGMLGSQRAAIDAPATPQQSPVDAREPLLAPSNSDLADHARRPGFAAPYEDSGESWPPVWNSATHPHEPAIVEVQQEVADLRRLIESQLSSLVWHDKLRRDPYRAAVLRELARLGLQPTLARRIAEQLPQAGDKRGVMRHLLARLQQLLPLSTTEHIDEGGAIALVGPTGVGKTTSIAKLAARFAMKHGRDHLALITTDNYRIGAHDQLLTFARILGVPVRTARDSDELAGALAELRERKLVLIDTAGISQRDLRLPEHLALLQQSGTPVRVLLTLAANTDAATMHEVVRRYAALKPIGCVLTKLDEAVRLGGAISTMIEHQLPLAYAADGQRVPEDIHWAQSKKLNLVRRAAELSIRSPVTIEDETMVVRETQALADA